MPSSDHDLAAMHAQVKQYWQPGTESDSLRLAVRTLRPQYWMNADGSTKCTVKKKQPVILINNNAHVNMHESTTCSCLCIVGSGLRVVEGRGRGGGRTQRIGLQRELHTFLTIHLI